MITEKIKLLYDADTSQAEGKLKSMTSRVSTVANTALVAGGLKLLKDGVKDASDLGEASNLFNKTMGGARKQVDALVSKSSELGMSHGEMAEYASQYSATLDGIGFKHKDIAKTTEMLIKRQADAGSFYNKENDEMNMRIKMAIRGSAEATQGLGKAMTINNLKAFEAKELHGKAYNKLSEQEKVMVRIKFFMAQTKTSANDFKDSLSGSLPNQLKKLHANFVNIGGELMQKILPSIIKVMDWMNNNMDTVVNIGKAFLAWKIGSSLFSGLARIKRDLKTIKSESASASGGKGSKWKGKAGAVAGGAVAGAMADGGWTDISGWVESAGMGALSGSPAGVGGAFIGGGVGIASHAIKLLLDGKETTQSVAKNGKSGQTNVRGNS